MQLTQADEHLEFTVHNYISSVSLPPSATSIIEAGRRVVQFSRSTSGWSSVMLDLDVSIQDLSRASYSFSKTPPILYATKDPALHGPILKEWGAPTDLSDGDILEMLSEFESTNLDYLESFTSHRRVSHDDTNVSTPGTDTDASKNLAINLSLPAEELDAHPTKRRRLDNGYLHHLIPQPHYRPSSANASSPQKSHSFARYKRSRPVAIPPYDLCRAKEHLSTPYTRAAWIVPVRGTLHWEAATAAALIDMLDDTLPSGPTSESAGDTQPKNCITWTHAALRFFWDFLLSIQQVNVFGNLSLSFHTAPPHNFAVNESKSIEFNSIGGGNRDIFSAEIATKSFAQEPFRSSLLAVDHIKLYHDVEHAMYLRNALDAWSYHSLPVCTDEEMAAGQVEAEKIRMLKGARLVLVDENSEGILYC